LKRGNSAELSRGAYRNHKSPDNREGRKPESRKECDDGSRSWSNASMTKKDKDWILPYNLQEEHDSMTPSY
jgi:hypothetical protein